MSEQCKHPLDYNAGFCPWCELHERDVRIKTLEAVAEQADRAIAWRIRNGFLTVEDKALLKRLQAAGYTTGEGE